MAACSCAGLKRQSGRACLPKTMAPALRWSQNCLKGWFYNIPNGLGVVLPNLQGHSKGTLATKV
jgi:hypothetical protein